MSLSGGSCSVAADGTVTGDGLAVPIAQAYVQTFQELVAAGDIDPKISGWMQVFAPRLGAAIVDYLKANAEVVVTIRTTDDRLQRTPDGDTLGPTTNRTVLGEIT